MNGKIGSLIAAMLLAVTNAIAVGAPETCYVPAHGQGMTACVPAFDSQGNLVEECAETLGTYSILLRRRGLGAGEWVLRLDGPLRGLADPGEPPTFNHVLGDTEGRGLLYTAGDYFETAVPEGACLLHVREVLNVVFGIGVYADAQGTLVVEGTLDQCSGVNDFRIVAGEGEICFGTGEVP